MKSEKEEINNSLKILARSSVIVFIGFFLSKVFTYLYRILIARNFDVQIYGTFTLALMVVGWLTVFSTMGLSQGVVRYVAFYRSKKKVNQLRFVFQNSIQIVLISSLILGAALYFLAEPIAINIFDNPSLVIFLKAFSILVPITALFEILLSAIQAYEKIGWFSFIFNILQNFVKVALLGTLVLIGINYTSVIYSHILGILVALIFSWIIVSKALSPKIMGDKKLKEQEKKSITSKLLNYSWPLMFFGVVAGILAWTDTLIIGIFLSASEVGIYNAAVPIAILLGLIPGLFMDLFFPLITREYANKKFEAIKQLSQQVGKWIFVINFPLFILITLFPGAFLNILFGPEFLGAEQSLRLLAIGYIFSSVFTVSYRLLSVIGKTRLILLDISLVSLMNILLNIYLVPRFGINGAAFSTAISLILLNSIFAFQTKKYIGIIPIRRKILGIFLISFIPTAALLLIRQQLGNPGVFSLIILTGFFVLSYLGLILLIKGFDKNDIGILKAFKRKLFKGTS